MSADTPEKSPVQKHWERLARELRRALLRKVQLVDQMNCEEASHLANTLREAYRLEYNAELHDSSIERERTRQYCESQES